MKIGDVQVGTPETIYSDTLANINALTGITAGMIAYATDTKLFGIYNGSSWTWGASQVNADWNSVSGASQILNKPSIPSAQVNSDWNSSSGLSQILNKPTIPSLSGGIQPVFFVDGTFGTATSIGPSIVMGAGATIQKVYMYLSGTGTSGSSIIDIHKNGTTIFTTQANRPTVAYNSSTHKGVGVPDVVSLVEGDVLTLDIDQAATLAKSLTVVIVMVGGATTGIQPSALLLTGDLNYYVSTTGDDSLNNGLTAGAPFLTIQKAIDSAALLNTGTHNIIINVADGTYTVPDTGVNGRNVSGSGMITIQGNDSNPGNVIVQIVNSNTSAPRNCVFMFQNINTVYRISGMQLQTSGTRGSCKGVIAEHSNVKLGVLIFGKLYVDLYAFSGSNVIFDSAYTVDNTSGQYYAHIVSSYGAMVEILSAATLHFISSANIGSIYNAFAFGCINSYSTWSITGGGTISTTANSSYYYFGVIIASSVTIAPAGINATSDYSGSISGTFAI